MRRRFAPKPEAVPPPPVCDATQLSSAEIDARQSESALRASLDAQATTSHMTMAAVANHPAPKRDITRIDPLAQFAVQQPAALIDDDDDEEDVKPRHHEPPMEIEAVDDTNTRSETSALGEQWNFLSIGKEETAQAHARTSKLLEAAVATDSKKVDEGGVEIAPKPSDLNIFQIPPRAMPRERKPGKIGSLKIHKSGRVVLHIGPHQYDVHGASPSCAHSVVAIVTDGTPRCVELGSIDAKFMCVPSAE
eukprot:PhM_4_TR6151/c0_g1_i1/m.52315